MHLPINYSSFSQILIGISLLLTGTEWAYLSAQKNLKIFFDETMVLLRLQDIGIYLRKSKNKKKGKLMLSAKEISYFNIFCGLSLIITSFIKTRIILDFVLVLSLLGYLLYNVRNGFGFEGSDQMIIVTLTCLIFIQLFPKTTSMISQFMAIQLMLAYFIAGFSKILSKHWRSGQAIKMVLSTKSFGVGNINWLLKWTYLPQVLCFAVIAFEITWILLPVNFSITVILMACGIIFHFLNASLMGLNNFFWAFIATYPIALQGVSIWQH